MILVKLAWLKLGVLALVLISHFKKQTFIMIKNIKGTQKE